MNLELAQLVLTQLTEHPETYSKGALESSGGRRNIVGWIVTLCGWRFETTSEGVMQVVSPIEARYSPEDAAAKLLKIDEHAAKFLFDPDSCTQEVVAKLQYLIEGYTSLEATAQLTERRKSTNTYSTSPKEF